MEIYICINFCGLNVSEDYTECESSYIYFYWFFTCLWNKYYLQVYLDNCAYKTTNKQMTDYLDENLFWRFNVINAVLWMS